jgi:two-component system sensor histidine kinase RegB
LIAQLLTITIVSRLFDAAWSIPVLLLASVVLLAANIQAIRRLSVPRPVGSRVLLGQLALDVGVLSTFLLLSGGPDNPFIVLYLVHVAMGAVMLPARFASVLTGFVVTCYGALHLSQWPLHLERHALGEPALLVAGNLVALTISAVTVTYFIVGLASTLRWREKLLRESQERTARTDRLRSVGTMAAGAAHELNTPLSTIGLRLRRVTRRHEDSDTVGDLDAIRSQLERCNDIVQQLLIGAGDPSASHLMRGALVDFVDDAVGMWSHGNGVDVELSDESDEAEVEVPRTAFVQGLVNLLENAREAQHEASNDVPIEIELVHKRGFATVIVRDHGAGLPDDSDRVGEPFFTTKATGTGLGVFVARAVADGSGGGLRYVSRPGCTEARWSFPTTTRRP